MPGIRQPALPLRELFGSPLVGRGRLSPSSPSRASPAASRRCWRRPARGKPLPAPSGDLPSSARVSAASVPKLSQVIDAPCEHLVTRSATDATDVIKLHNHRLFFFFFFFKYIHLPTERSAYLLPSIMHEATSSTEGYIFSHTLQNFSIAVPCTVQRHHYRFPQPSPIPSIRIDFAEKD